MFSSTDSLDELNLNLQLDHFQAPQSRGVLGFVYVDTDTIAHARS